MRRKLFFLGVICLISCAILALGLGTNLVKTQQEIAVIRGIQAKSQPIEVPATVRDASDYGQGIARALYLLASSTPTHKKTIKILVYGQSITQQEWWLEVIDNLRQKFPYANLIVENRAIGGFTTPILVRTANHDLYPFYPDLTIFHDYGDRENYEKIIARTRSLTTSEMAIISDHVTWLPGEETKDESAQMEGYKWHNQHAQWLQQLARKYGCELIDIRTPWEDYLQARNLPSAALLKDSVHLNERGNSLMAELVSAHLLQSPIPQEKDLDTSVIEYPESDLQWQNGELVLNFIGNRVDLIPPNNIGDRSIRGEITIDGKRPSAFPDLYTISRSSSGFGSYNPEWPAIIHLESARDLLVEDWNLIITDASPEMDRFNFDLYGSQTGFDGSGASTEKFISNSQMMVIEPENWWLKKTYDYTKEPIPIGFHIKWQVKPMFVDFYRPPLVSSMDKEYATTIAQNLKNTKHVLKIVARGGNKVPIQAIRVYRPLINSSL